MASTLRQCPKCYWGGEKKINGNIKSFTGAESQLLDARFFEEDDAAKETMSSVISSMGKSGTKNGLQASKGMFPNNTIRMKKVNRETCPRLSSKCIKRLLPQQVHRC